MNIFLLDNDAAKCALLLDDLRLVKMPTEHLQMLGAAIQEHSNLVPAQTVGKAHQNHPCTVWAKQYKENFEFLRLYTHELILRCYDVFERDIGYYEKWESGLKVAYNFNPAVMRSTGTGCASSPPLCMPENYRNYNNVVESYQRFLANKPNLRFVRQPVPDYITEYRDPNLPPVITNAV